MFKSRPAAAFCAIFLTAVAVFSYLPWWGKVASIFIIAVLAFGTAGILSWRFLFIVRRKALQIAALVTISAALAGIVTGIYYDAVMAKKASYGDGEAHNITAYATEISSDQVFGTTYYGVITSIDGKKVKIHAVVETDVSIGDKTYVGGEFRAVLYQGASYTYAAASYAPYHYDAVLYACMGDVMLSDDNDDDAAVGEYSELTRVRTLGSLLNKANEYFDALLYDRLNGDGHALSSALLLGNRSHLPATMPRDFRTFGVSHLLALSGLHLSILMGMLSWLLILCRVPKRARAIALIAAVAAFAAITGFPASVLRAGIMFILFLAAELTTRRGDSIVSLFAAGTLIVLFSPSAIFDVGLQLSFFATLGLLTIGPKWRLSIKNSDRVAVRALKRLSNSITVTLSAMLLTIPFMWLYFGQISLISPLSNLVFIPIVTVILVAAPFVLMLGWIPYLGDFVAWIVNTASGWIVGLSNQARHLTGGVISLNYSFMKFLIPMLAVGVAALLIAYPRRKYLYALPPIAFALIFALSLGVWTVTVKSEADFVCVRSGVNEMAVVRSNNKTALIDMGNGGGSALYKAELAVRERLSGTNVDTLILTHYHKKHNALLHSLAEREYLRNLFIPEPANEADSDALLRLTDSAKLLGINVIVYPHEKSDGVIVIGNARLTIAKYGKLSRSAHPVLSFVVTVGESEIIYVGASAAERYTLARPNAKNISYVFGVHGPIYKNAVPESILDLSATAYIGSETVAQFVPTGFRREYVFYGKEGVILVQIRRS